MQGAGLLTILYYLVWELAYNSVNQLVIMTIANKMTQMLKYNQNLIISIKTNSPPSKKILLKKNHVFVFNIQKILNNLIHKKKPREKFKRIRIQN